MTKMAYAQMIIDDGFSNREAEVKEIKKNNDQILTGIVFKGDTFSPTIYIDKMYEDNLSIGEAIQKVKEALSNSKNESIDFDPNDMTDFDKVKDRIISAVVNKENNQRYLDEKIHKDFLDLAIVYKVFVGEYGDGIATITIPHKYLDVWGVTVDDLDKAATENNPRINPAVTITMAEAIGVPEEMFPASEMPMLVLSNKDRGYGATSMLYSKELKNIADRFEDDVCIIPSSIHEVLVLPSKIMDERADMVNIIKEINTSAVPAGEVLSDHPYKYIRETGQIIAA